MPLADRVDVGELGEFELRRMVFNVDRTDFDVVEKEVRNIVERPSTQPGTTAAADPSIEVKLPGRVIALTASKALMVTETGGHLRSIDQLMRGLAGDGVKAFKLQHISLDEALVVIKPLVGIPADLNQTPDGSVKLSPWGATNTLLVTAKPDVLKSIESIIEKIDVKPVTDTGAPPPVRPELRIYSTAGDSQTIFQVLQTMLSGNAGSVRLHRDASNNTIVALCLAEQHAVIKETIKKLEGEGLKKFRVWELAASADAAIVLATVNEILGVGGSAPSASTSPDSRTKVAAVNASAPKVIINTNNRTMLAFGTDAQLNQIDDLLGVQKWSAVAAKEGVKSNPSKVRVFAFHRDAAELLRQHFSSVRRNPIEIVVPSAQRGSVQPETIDSNRGKSLMHAPSVLPKGGSDADRNGSQKPTAAPTTPAAPGRAGDRSTMRFARPALATYAVARLAVQEPAGSDAERAPPATKEGKPMKMKRKSAFIERDPLPEPRTAPVGNDSPTTKPNPTVETPAVEPKAAKPQPAAEPAAKPGELPGSPDKPVKITITEKGIIVSSEDPEAIAAVEELLALLPPDPVASGNFKIYYLKHIPAATAKQELDQILTGDTTESGGTSAAGNLVGDVASSMFGGLGGSMVSGLLGAGQSGGVGSLVSGTALIVPDERLNALIVQASPAEQTLIEQVLQHIDAEDGPDTKVERKPGMIPVYFTSADEIAAIVKELYQDRLIGGRGAAQANPQQQFFEAIARNAGGGNRNQRNQRRNEDLDKMSVSVDARFNALIVVAPKPLFDQVEHLVGVLDRASEEPSNDVRRVVKMSGLNADALSKALQAIGGPKVQTTTPTPATTPGTPGTPGTTTQPGTFPAGSPFDAQRIFQMQQGIGRGRGQGGGFPGGGFPGGGFPNRGFGPGGGGTGTSGPGGGGGGGGRLPRGGGR